MVFPSDGIYTAANWAQFGIEIHCGWEDARREKEKVKSPQGYDEDNASLDKFCKIKGKKREKKVKRKHEVNQLRK